MTVDQIIKYVTETPNNTNPNVLYSLIQQGIATNWQPDPDPSAVRFLSFVAHSGQATNIEELPLNFEVPSEVYINKTFYEVESSSIRNGIPVMIDMSDESENSKKYGILNKWAVDYDIIAKTSSNYDLAANRMEFSDIECIGIIISYTDPIDLGELFEKKCTIDGQEYYYTTVTVKCGVATFIFDMGIEQLK